ncbi:inovirus Gp2 family protein [Massilia sp. YIM B04103]|uniref:inovirus Gp2 family protein n=1 Tax=Massilia sp. YIM B04103 TaxID=2963106 RepID=UPI00210E877A|nr:inovirus Gp2 family protein [Massilia sp. YIM B04103]
MNYQQFNPNHTYHFGNEYAGLPIQDKGPFISECLERFYLTINRALNQYREVFAFRFDLRLPANHIPDGSAYENEIIDRFIESFKAKIKHNRQMALRENPYAHDSVVRYVWAREVGQRGRPHYHLAILLNKDAFRALGAYAPGRDNMFNRLQEAWASALNLPASAVSGLVHIPDNACYFLHRDDRASIAAFFFRVSYLCKAATKAYGHGGHGFGSSRT